jgi:hypothetical protein
VLLVMGHVKTLRIPQVGVDGLRRSERHGDLQAGAAGISGTVRATRSGPLWELA